ncbi:MAG: SEC-C metal-binding domain-containing protein [Acidimicrobiia bacterium]|nr:SEC-C metal-binding domain-containing protein [Acidimicrobiia bacterium]
MGRVIKALIDHELMSALGELAADGVPIIVDRAEEQLVAREAQLAARERDATVERQRLGRQNERLRLWESDLIIRQQRIDLAAKPSLQSTTAGPKIGRNDRCPCGSGLKHKRCHGITGR